MKEDVKNKFFPLPSRGDADLASCIQPTSFVEGFLVLALWIAAFCSGDADPSRLSQLNRFM